MSRRRSTRGIDEHRAAMRELDGRLVDRPTGTTWCPVHGNPANPRCSACAGDHIAGEHHSLPPVPTCLHCRPMTTTTHADRSAR